MQKLQCVHSQQLGDSGAHRRIVYRTSFSPRPKKCKPFILTQRGWWRPGASEHCPYSQMDKRGASPRPMNPEVGQEHWEWIMPIKIPQRRIIGIDQGSPPSPHPSPPGEGEIVAASWENDAPGFMGSMRECFGPERRAPAAVANRIEEFAGK